MGDVREVGAPVARGRTRPLSLPPAKTQRTDRRHLGRVDLPPAWERGRVRPLQLLVRHKLDGIKWDVSQQERAVAGKHAADALAGDDRADSANRGPAKLARLHALLDDLGRYPHHGCGHARGGARDERAQPFPPGRRLVGDPALDGLVHSHEDGGRGHHACQVAPHARIQGPPATGLE